MEPLSIRSALGDYQVEFFDTFEAIWPALLDASMIVVDHNVFSRLPNELPTTLMIDASEERKTLETVGEIAQSFQACGCNRSSMVVAIGGGIVQDVVSFAAHVFHRGMRWIFVPTTLLAMADSCIGGKSCLNLGGAKNQLGAFHPPCRVLICPRFIDTLPDAEIASGYGEVVKLSWTGSAECFGRVAATVEANGLRNKELPAIIRRSLLVKREYIERDEFDRGDRKLLNYGHTFGHALEALVDIPHGLAVAWGMDLVNYIAWQRGVLQKHDFFLVHRFIQRYLPFGIPEVDAERLIALVRRDKKSTARGVNLVLSRGPGRLHIELVMFDCQLCCHVKEYLQTYNVYDNRPIEPC